MCPNCLCQQYPQSVPGVTCRLWMKGGVSVSAPRHQRTYHFLTSHQHLRPSEPIHPVYCLIILHQRYFSFICFTLHCLKWKPIITPIWPRAPSPSHCIARMYSKTWAQKRYTGDTRAFPRLSRSHWVQQVSNVALIKAWYFHETVYPH